MQNILSTKMLKTMEEHVVIGKRKNKCFNIEPRNIDDISLSADCIDGMLILIKHISI